MVKGRYCVKQRANALDLSTVQALNKLSAFEHPVERYSAMLSLVESNLKLVKLLAQQFLCLVVIHVWLNKVEGICTATLKMFSPHTRSA